ncbi:MAG: PorP/SprF family type IX secretion system membrane protein [Bacteroidota bacterium]
MSKLLQYPLLLFFLGVVLRAPAQDLHFSQYYHSPQNLNPALAGVMAADYRISSLYRSQWQSVPVPYLTYTGSFDLKYFLPRHREGFLGGGLLFNYDRAGSARWRVAHLGLSLNYSRALNEGDILTAGFQIGRAQRSLNVGALTFANQYNGEQFDPNRATGEDNLQDNGFGYTDLSVGLNWNFTRRRGRGVGTSSGNLGLSIAHVNQPELGVYTSTRPRLPARITVYNFGWIELPGSERLDLFYSVYGTVMGTSNEAMLGADLRYHLDAASGKKVALSLGLHYRPVGINDALFPVLKVFYESWTVGFSYDINLSEFRVATDGRGGPEVSVIYTITTVKPLKTFRACPIF